jgi:deazaflavin-dependent oxidoreductase (nitroreductase family)
VSTRSRAARVFGRTMRMTSVLDRSGTRWLFHALAPPPTVIVLVHRGRKSGRLYKTPVSILVEQSERAEVVVSPMWSRKTDWYLNVVAGGLVEVHVRGERRQVSWRELDEAERRAAGDAFRAAHPIYSRIILRTLVRLNGLEGDPAEAVVQALPMLALRKVGS